MNKTSSNVAIYVATHKKIDADLPCGYFPVQVNCANTNEHWKGYLHDDDGENISDKNPSYCELSVLYWAWKNSNAKIKGLSHYRRYLSSDSTVELKPILYGDLNTIKNEIISENEIETWLNNYDILLAMPMRPYPLTEMEDLEIYCYRKDIAIMIEVVQQYFPEYSDTLRSVLESKHLYHYNMMISHDWLYDSYCEWLFDVLNRIELRCNIENYDTQHKRLFGYLSEVLLNVYIEKNRYKKKFFRVVSPYQYSNLIESGYKRERIINCVFKFSRKLRLYFVVEKYYCKKNIHAYNQYLECCKYLSSIEDERINLTIGEEK